MDPSHLTQKSTEALHDAQTRALLFGQISQEARRYIAQQGFNPVYGARPLRRFISREVETRIGRAWWPAMSATAPSSVSAWRTAGSP